MSLAAIVSVLALGSANALTPGSYICSVEERAGVGSTHLEGASPPEAFVDPDGHYRFRFTVTAEGTGFAITEAPYDGPERNRAQWQDDNSTLHSAYIGDGRVFRATEGVGYLTVGANRWGDDLQFFHSGFEYAGGEDEIVSVRWGTCERE